MNRRINIPRQRRFPYQPTSIGRQVVEALKKFEAANGKGWRS